jgi:hypothetical protein
MKFKTFICAFSLLTLCEISFAQSIKFNFPKFKTESAVRISYSTSDHHPIQNNYSFSKIFLSTKRPMFCKMEDNLHKRFNVWIVFRAGLDEEYRKLIAVKKE